MWRPPRLRALRQPKAERPAGANYLRDRLAMLLAFITIACICGTFLLSKDTQFLMPGPLTSSHAAIEKCSTCHTKSGDGKLTWVHGLVGDPLADSKACLSCHKMPDTAFNAHGASAEALKNSTERLTKVAATTPAPLSARAQSVASPTDGVLARGVSCATCHQEHQGAKANLKSISNEQCRSCHVVKFDSFDGGHPQFEKYPFKQRTPIIYDHAGHGRKHFPEVAKKDPTKRIPETCSTCHGSAGDKRIMGVAPFEKTCGTCHLDQITGKERASGPKGIAFLSLPGLDLETLKKKKAAIGEWPDTSEAELTPFMKVMISRNEPGQALIKSVDKLNLQDLSRANNEQIRAVTALVWEIKRLFHALIIGKASDVLGDLGIGGGAKLSAELIADLTASLPRDVVVSAQQQWLPNLGTEMANRKDAREKEPGGVGWITTTTESKSTVDSDTATIPTPGRLAQAAAPKTDGSKDAAAAAEPSRRAGDQTDDLLFPTEEELRAIAAPVRDAVRANRPKGGAGRPEPAPARPEGSVAADAAPPARSDAAVAKPQNSSAPVVGIESNVDPENWAEYGGWYRQDHAVFYRPAGHKDKFIYSWLFLTGPQAPKGGQGPASAVFAALAGKDAQGSCTKCHSVDDIKAKGRVVNFSPPSAKSRQGRFTHFVHEPHFGILEKRGCQACHSLEKDRPYLKSYEQGNPQNFVPSFGPVKKDTCQTCHTSAMARQDCLTCHKYHVHDVQTPIMNTRLPTE